MTAKIKSGEYVNVSEMVRAGLVSKFRLRASARRDLQEIGRYTRHTWGRDQADRYIGSHGKVFSTPSDSNSYLYQWEVAAYPQLLHQFVHAAQRHFRH